VLSAIRPSSPPPPRSSADLLSSDSGADLVALSAEERTRYHAAGMRLRKALQSLLVLENCSGVDVVCGFNEVCMLDADVRTVRVRQHPQPTDVDDAQVGTDARAQRDIEGRQCERARTEGTLRVCTVLRLLLHWYDAPMHTPPRARTHTGATSRRRSSSCHGDGDGSVACRCTYAQVGAVCSATFDLCACTHGVRRGTHTLAAHHELQLHMRVDARGVLPPQVCVRVLMMCDVTIVQVASSVTPVSVPTMHFQGARCVSRVCVYARITCVRIHISYDRHVHL
jgi:hypothetical protein